jgi:SET domain-containing protein
MGDGAMNLWCERPMTPWHVKASPVHGLGVFARKFIPQGAIWWSGKREEIIEITRRQYEVLRESRPSRMLADVHEHSYYEAASDRLLYICNNGRYINHSSTPNVAMHCDALTSIALRDIDRGEELFEDYRTYDVCPWAELWGEFGKQLRR